MIAPHINSLQCNRCVE